MKTAKWTLCTDGLNPYTVRWWWWPCNHSSPKVRNAHRALDHCQWWWRWRPSVNSLRRLRRIGRARAQSRCRWHLCTNALCPELVPRSLSRIRSYKNIHQKKKPKLRRRRRKIKTNEKKRGNKEPNEAEGKCPTPRHRWNLNRNKSRFESFMWCESWNENRPKSRFRLFSSSSFLFYSFTYDFIGAQRAHTFRGAHWKYCESKIISSEYFFFIRFYLYFVYISAVVFVVILAWNRFCLPYMHDGDHVNTSE